jgi:methylenetetrahydrofolate reductase (NADPH)
VGASLRFLKKNRTALARMFAPGGYDPNKLLVPLATDLKPLQVEGLHVFTFNQVVNTVEWQRKAVANLRP